MYRDQVKYHKEFMRAQDIASNLAKKYNEALSQVQTHFRDSLHDIPRIEFIEPVSIYCHLFSMLMTYQPQLEYFHYIYSWCWELKIMELRSLF